MKILVIGSGGREHALVWKLSQSREVDKIFCAPGNAGISRQAECVDIRIDDLRSLLNFALEEKIGLTVVGPEAPLALGIVDQFTLEGLDIFGPNKKAAQLETSKVFAKEFMDRYEVPTADFKVFDDLFDAKKYIYHKGVPIVIKADGLCQGKGVVVAKTIREAESALESILRDRVFGEAGRRVVIEDCLQGEEASILLFTDSQSTVTLPSCQDHKRVFDKDLGPNTGGMGAYSPAPIVTERLLVDIEKGIIRSILEGLAVEHIVYQGVLYIGVMITEKGPKVLEFNVRFGDPETQAILPRMQTDLTDIMLATIHGQLHRFVGNPRFSWDRRACVCVVCASGGYPADYQKGKVISGLEEASLMSDIVVFHSGTKLADENGRPVIVTNGGRVLGVTGLGYNISSAINKTYQAVEKIQFEGMHYRRDIGKRALQAGRGVY